MSRKAEEVTIGWYGDLQKLNKNEMLTDRYEFSDIQQVDMLL